MDIFGIFNGKFYYWQFYLPVQIFTARDFQTSRFAFATRNASTAKIAQSGAIT